MQSEILFCDSRKTWNSEVFQFTACVEETFLVWIPSLFLWLFLGAELYFARTSRYKSIKWNFFNIAKFVILGILIFLTLADLIVALIIKDYFIVDILNPIVKILTFSICGYLLRLDKKCGIRASAVLFVFWLLMVLLSTPRLIGVIINFQGFIDQLVTTITYDTYSFISYSIYYFLITIQFVLSCFADATPRHSTYNDTSSESHPVLSAGIINHLFFLWFNKLIWKGFRKPLEINDISDLCPSDKSSEVYPVFEKEWIEVIEKKQNENKYLNSISLIKVLFNSFGGRFWLGGFFGLLFVLLEVMSPLVLQLLIQFISGEDSIWRGVFYAILFSTISFLLPLLEGQHLYHSAISGIRAKTALLVAIYKKSLRKLNVARDGQSSGEIVNLMSVDAQRFLELPLYLHTMWHSPISIILIIFLLWRIIGPSILAGFLVLFLMIPISLWIAEKLKFLQMKQMVFKDQRIRIVNEILNGIKVLKLQAWEPSFEAQVKEIREKEIKTLKTAAIYNAASFFIWTMAPYFVALVAFATFVMTDENNVLTTEKAFVALALINILKYPMYLFSMLVTMLTQALVSVKRIARFLNSDELKEDNVTHNKSENSVEIKQGSFSWYGDKIILKNIDMAVKKGSIVAVVGPVGSGKSSVISAILGEMNKLTGNVNTDGKIAYVPQQAWIQNCTLQQNITFGQQLEKDRYNRVIEACALVTDLKILPGGDQIEIGEKGINLSGGQKQRISLARAVYSDADIYLLDDPLSAVDSHVGKHIFENVLSENGVLAGKTRVVVTNALSFLPFVDEIFVISNGEITEQGSYKKLVEMQGTFSKLLEEFTEQQKEDETTEDSSSKKSLESSQKLTNESSNTKTTTTTTVTEKSNLTKDEEIFIGKVSFQVYLRYLKNAGIWTSLSALVFIVIYQTFSVLSSWSLTQWTSDENIANGTETQILYLSVYGGLGLFQAVFILLAALSIAIATISTSRNLHDLLTNNILRLPVLFFDTNPLGRILNRFSKDIDALDNLIPHTVRRFLIGIIDTIAILVVIVIASPLFVIFIVPLAVLYYFLQKLFITTSRQIKRLESIWRSPIYSHFSETLSGLPVIRASLEQDRFASESRTKIDVNQKTCFAATISNRWLGVNLESLGAFILLIVALYAVLSRSSVSPALAALSLTYALQVSQALRILVRMSAEMETNIVAVERIEEYSTVPQEAEWTNDVEVDPKWPEKGEIEFKDFQFRYREGLDLALRGISFSVKTQEKIGIVGRTGAGKSSLTLALFRIVEPAGGSIVIDGVDISELGLHTLRSRLTIIPQDPVLFSGTLRLNLDPFQSYSDEAIWMALEHSHLKTFVQSLPKGLNHEISENGENLSVGQRQLVCLARALLKKTKILILDEATAAIDVETDELIQQTIRNQFADCTILTIAHRINTILDSDRILLLENGIIAEFDSPEVLLNDKSSKFYSLAKEAKISVSKNV